MNRPSSSRTRRRFALGAAGAGVVIVALVALLVWSPWSGDDTSSSDGDETGEPDDVSAPPATFAVGNELLVTHTDDSGDGSLRAAIDTANGLDGPAVIRFDSVDGPFADPQVITLESPLPDIVGDVTVDGYIEDQLWKATGVAVSGDEEFRVFEVASEGRLTLRSLTVADGRASEGAGVLNHGTLVVRGVTLMNNVADDAGGGLANSEGTTAVVNSTFTMNGADAGGGLANLDGRVSVVNSTFSENTADEGGGLINRGDILVANTILANSPDGADCVSTGDFDADSTNNLIEEHSDCGDPITTADPVLEGLNYYNGPAQTLPLRSGSPAINLGDNEAAIDEYGEPLRWDQRGNGDPRFVAGYTDIGAFEHQAFPDFTVDTLDDVGLRACTTSGQGDCTLRAAIELANATDEPDVIVFDPAVFDGSVTLRLDDELPEVTSDLTLDASTAGRVTIEGVGEIRTGGGVDLSLVDVEVR